MLLDYAAYFILGISASLLRTVLTHGDLLATATMCLAFVVGICMCWRGLLVTCAWVDCAFIGVDFAFVGGDCAFIGVDGAFKGVDCGVQRLLSI